MKWDEWRGSFAGDKVMLTKHLVSLPGLRVDLHAFVGADAADCFHTHPAIAIRIVLFRAYVEEHESGRRQIWRAGDIGIVWPSTSHRVCDLPLGRPAYTLWIRLGPKIAPVQLRGRGWPSTHADQT